jgi:NADH-quinone oxidoreductase subunit N
MMVGVVAFSVAGVSALVFYIAAYALMNLAAFGVIVIRERETAWGDDIRSVEGLARERPGLAAAMTVSMLALAGLPGTAGFIGKLYLIEATVESDYTWLGVMIAIGTMISLAYYLRVIAAIWMRPAREREPETMPAMAGASQEADEAVTGARCKVILALVAIAAAATVFFGVIPSPLVDWATEAGEALGSVLD